MEILFFISYYIFCLTFLAYYNKKKWDDDTAIYDMDLYVILKIRDLFIIVFLSIFITPVLIAKLLIKKYYDDL